MFRGSQVHQTCRWTYIFTDLALCSRGTKHSGHLLRDSCTNFVSNIIRHHLECNPKEKACELEHTTWSQAFTSKCARIDYFPFICGVPWLFVCSEFFHLIWGVHSFHLQCAVNFFYSVCSVSLCCVGVHLIFHWQCWFNFILSVFDLVCSSIFL